MKEENTVPLPHLLRLALSYAPHLSRDLFASLFALDTKFAGIIRQSREPMLAQMRLAWWRETLEKPVQDRPTGDPLLATLAPWEGEEAALCGLAAGWEQLLAEPILEEKEIQAFAAARGECFAALARLTGLSAYAKTAHAAGALWALADLAQGLSDTQERTTVHAIMNRTHMPRQRLPRTLRPLTILAGLARRSIAKGEGALLVKPTDMIVAVRLGLIGR